MTDFVGSVAVVTGAGSGIGREIACALAGQGAVVVCTGRREAALDATVERIVAEGGRGLALVADVADPLSVERLMATVKQRLGRLDVLINNAGRFHCVAPVWETDIEDWHRDVVVNLFGVFHMCRGALPLLRATTAGVIVNLDGGGGANGANPGGSAYAASKAGVVRFTETLARELERDGSDVLVIGLNPGFVRTEMTEALSHSPWQGHVRDGFATGRNRPTDWCARTLIDLLGILGPDLNGRTFDKNLCVDDLATQRARVVSEGRYLMRTADLSVLPQVRIQAGA